MSTPMIQTKQDWREWVLASTPDPPTKANANGRRRPTTADQKLDARHRQAYNAQLPVIITPRMSEIFRLAASTVRINECAAPTARRGIVIDGDPTVGKTTFAITFGKRLELELRDLYPLRFTSRIERDGVLVDYCPVVYITSPAASTPKMLAMTIADYLGVPYRSRDNTDDITRRVLRAMSLCGVELLIVDDIHFLDLSQKDGRLANDFLKQLANLCAATFLYAGVELQRSSLFNEGAGTRRDTQTSGRFTLYPLDRFSVATREEQRTWATVIKSMEGWFLLERHQVGSLAGSHWRYLHDRTRGSIASLSHLLRIAADEAIESGSEQITIELLEKIKTDVASQEAFDRSSKARSSAAVDSEVVPFPAAAVS